jgi:hypothetical protein
MKMKMLNTYGNSIVQKEPVFEKVRDIHVQEMFTCSFDLSTADHWMQYNSDKEY